jgi:flagellar hook-basal body complex protein FliE
MRIEPLARVNPLERGLKAVSSSVETAGIDFGKVLDKVMSDVAALQQKAAAMQEAYALGRVENLAEVVTATQEAGVALQLVVAVRNKVIEAYQEISRMPV